MNNARNVYVVLMLIAGLAMGALVVQRPALSSAAIPPVMWLLIVSLIIDIAAMAYAARSGGAPLAMNARFIGFFGAAALYLLVTYVSGVTP